MAKPRFKIEWYQDEVMRELESMTRQEQRNAARRLVKGIRRNIIKEGLIGKREIKAKPGSKSWKTRKPGQLLASIRLHKSRFQGGGYTVFAGDDKNIYYAHWVEYGTVFMEKRKGYKYMRKALYLEKARFTRQLRKRLGV